MHPCLPETLKQFQPRERLRDEDRRREEVPQFPEAVLMKKAYPLLGPEDAEHIVETAVADGEVRVFRRREAAQVFLIGQARVQIDDFRTGQHDRGHVTVVEPENIAQHFALAADDGPGFRTLVDHGLYFLFRNRLLLIRVYPEETQQPARGKGQQRHKGTADHGKQRHGPGHETRHALGVDLPEAFGHEFPDDDGQVGDEGDDHRHRYGRGRGRSKVHVVPQPAGQRLGQCGFPENAAQ